MIEFEEIYKKHFRDVYRYILSLTHDEHIAEEITQETFLKALKSIERFDGRCQLYVWLCQIAKNTYFTSRKRTIKENTLVEEDYPDYSIEEKVLSKETLFEVHKVLHELGCVSKPKSMQVSCVPLAKCAQIWHNIANPNKGVAQYGKTI